MRKVYRCRCWSCQIVRKQFYTFCFKFTCQLHPCRTPGGVHGKIQQPCSGVPALQCKWGCWCSAQNRLGAHEFPAVFPPFPQEFPIPGVKDGQWKQGPLTDFFRPILEQRLLPYMKLALGSSAWQSWRCWKFYTWKTKR